MTTLSKLLIAPLAAALSLAAPPSPASSAEFAELVAVVAEAELVHTWVVVGSGQAVVQNVLTYETAAFGLCEAAVVPPAYATLTCTVHDLDDGSSDVMASATSSSGVLLASGTATYHPGHRHMLCLKVNVSGYTTGTSAPACMEFLP
jgi:hypothetical protein